MRIAELHAALRRGDVSCRELVLTCLRRIAAHDRAGPCLNAVISLNPGALARADALDRAREWAPLHGVPVLLKDSIDTAWMPTTGGSLAFLGVTPPRDAAIVARLTRAGAIVVAKANLDELTRGGWGASSVGGQTRNARDLNHSPGGSSGGTAVGLAAGYASVGVGTDTMGSIRVPASFNGVVGLRPTVGLVPRDGLMPLSTTSDTAGPMATCVEDAARLLEVLAERPGAYVQALDAPGGSVGVVRQLFGTGPVTDVVDEALATVRGVRTVDPVAHPEIDRLRLGSFDAWAGALSTWESPRAFEEYLRALGDAAPVGSFRELVEVGSVVPRVQRSLERSAGAGELAEHAYIKARAQLPLARALALRLMDEHGLDALCYPTAQAPPARLGEDQPGLNCAWSALTGLPALSVPVGTQADGLPVGLELLGRPWSEGTLLALAAAFERSVQERPSPGSAAPTRCATLPSASRPSSIAWCDSPISSNGSTVPSEGSIAPLATRSL